MKFIQTIAFSTSRIDDMLALADEYDRDQGGSAPGLIGTKVVKDRDRENAYMVIAEFESHELAMENLASIHRLTAQEEPSSIAGCSGGRDSMVKERGSQRQCSSSRRDSRGAAPRSG